MSLFIPVKARSTSVAVAVCSRCSFKVPYSTLVQDPNTQTWVCPKCSDLKDPYDLPARRADDISLNHPRSDRDLST